MSTDIMHIESAKSMCIYQMTMIDATSLYTNIPHYEARLVLLQTLDSRPCKEPFTHFLLDLIDIIMKKSSDLTNLFTFRFRYLPLEALLPPQWLSYI